jgi:rhamnosyl/mannosyltransferase
MIGKNRYLQIGKFYPPQWGGIETVTYNLEEALSEKGYKNSVLVYDNDQDNNGSSSKNSDVIRCKYNTLFGAPYSIGYLKKFIKIAKNYSHVICHVPNPWVIICLLMISYKGKLILYWHSDVVNKGILGFVLAPFELWLIRRASVVIAPTKAHIESSKYASKLIKKYKIVPYPINRDIFNIANNNINHKLVSDKAVNLVAIGRLVEYKGFKFLIEAVSLLPKNINYHLDIVGDGPLRGDLNELIAKLKLQNFISIHGSVSKDRLSNLLDRAHIFCFPSNTKAEMYGMVQYEAMAYGLPIIGADIPGSGVPLLLKYSGAGLLVELNSPEAIALAIVKIMNDPVLYSKLSMSGIEAIKNKFRPDFLIDEFCRAADAIF